MKNTAKLKAVSSKYNLQFIKIKTEFCWQETLMSPMLVKKQSVHKITCPWNLHDLKCSKSYSVLICKYFIKTACLEWSMC